MLFSYFHNILRLISYCSRCLLSSSRLSQSPPNRYPHLYLNVPLCLFQPNLLRNIPRVHPRIGRPLVTFLRHNFAVPPAAWRGDLGITCVVLLDRQRLFLLALSGPLFSRLAFTKLVPDRRSLCAGCSNNCSLPKRPSAQAVRLFGSAYCFSLRSRHITFSTAAEFHVSRPPLYSQDPDVVALSQYDSIAYRARPAQPAVNGDRKTPIFFIPATFRVI